jgi:ATP-dependent Clp protease protease subunit
MAVLKIYNDIAAEEDKVFYQWGMGTDAVCMKDIDEFIGAMSEDDEKIDIRLHCSGGLVSEGWAIYDKLRASGKKIEATVEGKCASMATVVLMAAPKEARKALPSARILVHNPWMPGYALGDAVTAQTLREEAERMQEEQDKILDLYVERCGCDRDEMQALMDEDKTITVERAMELGLIGEVVQPLSAKIKKDRGYNADSSNSSDSTNRGKINNQNREMKKVEVKQSWLERLLAKAGFAKMEEAVFGMELSTADGGTIEVEREEGEPQVGDAASPDGEHVMPDGRTIVVAEGVITEIKPAEEETPEESEEGEEKDEAQERISALEAEVAQLKESLAKAEGERDEALAKAKSKDELAILNAVKMAGGREWLAKNCSTYKVTVRKVDDTKAKEAVAKDEEESDMRKKINELKNKK